MTFLCLALAHVAIRFGSRLPPLVYNLFSNNSFSAPGVRLATRGRRTGPMCAHYHLKQLTRHHSEKSRKRAIELVNGGRVTPLESLELPLGMSTRQTRRQPHPRVRTYRPRPQNRRHLRAELARAAILLASPISRTACEMAPSRMMPMAVVGASASA